MKTLPTSRKKTINFRQCHQDVPFAALHSSEKFKSIILTNIYLQEIRLRYVYNVLVIVKCFCNFYQKLKTLKPLNQRLHKHKTLNVTFYKTRDFKEKLGL